MAIKTIGIVGTGAVGSMLAEHWSRAGYTILASDTNPEKLRKLNENVPSVQAVPQNEAVQADLAVFCVPADNLESAVADAAPHVKPHTIISGQSSVKTPEVAVFNAYFPNNPKVPIHSWHAPPSPVGQTLFVIGNIAPAHIVAEVEEACRTLGSVTKRVSVEMHDRLSADKQFLTHLAYLSMIRTWTRQRSFPWENSGIDAVKATIGQRIIAGEEHIYRNLAMLNPFVPEMAREYAKSVKALHEFRKDLQFLKNRLSQAQDLFRIRRLDTDISLLFESYEGTGTHVPNSHLSLIGVADTWASFGINPNDRFMANTPPSKLLEGIVRYVFTQPGLLEESMHTMLTDQNIKYEDDAFVKSVSEWANVVITKNHSAYTAMFNEAKSFFTVEQLAQAKAKSDEMLTSIKNKLPPVCCKNSSLSME